jgi:hypothetical protein
MAMKKHMQHRFSCNDKELLETMESLAADIESLGYDGVAQLASMEQTTNELEQRISRIDAIQAELWRRSQIKT